jgi:hypothetical protein
MPCRCWPTPHPPVGAPTLINAVAGITLLILILTSGFTIGEPLRAHAQRATPLPVDASLAASA